MQMFLKKSWKVLEVISNMTSIKQVLVKSEF